MALHWGWMDAINIKKFGIAVVFFIGFYYYIDKKPTAPRTNPPPPLPDRSSEKIPSWLSRKTITPLAGTKHLLVSAYLDQRVSGFDLRLIGIFRRDSIQPLYCLFCCRGMADSVQATIFQHSDDFGFPYVTTDVMCTIPRGCPVEHVCLVTDGDSQSCPGHTCLPIRNLKRAVAADRPLNFTVCISNLFGRYNNVLQFAQSLEMYRLLGVDRVVVYNTSCGPELERLLRGYSQEGFVEMVPWPINEHLTPSYGWQHSVSGGDVHYFGQQTTMNECIYRSMDRSRYVLLNDIDEIIMPYKHSGLGPLMDALQGQNPNAGVFIIENHIFPKKHFEPSNKFNLSQWMGVPGVNILQHIYREDPDRTIYHPHKLIVQPRAVEQTSVHEVLKVFGEQVKVPPDVCRIIHTREALRGGLTLEQLNVDKRLWDFSEALIPGVDAALRRAGLLGPQGRSGGKRQHPPPHSPLKI